MTMTDAAEVFGPVSVIMSFVIVITAAFLYYFTRRCKTEGWTGEAVS